MTFAETEKFELESEDQSDIINDGLRVGVNVGVNAQKVLDLITENPHISAEVVAESLGISKRQAERLFAQLKQLSLIKRIGADKNGHWEIITEK